MGQRSFFLIGLPGSSHSLTNGELLQGLNYLCNKGLRFQEKNRSAADQHPRNLDPPLPPCYLPA